MNKKNLLSSSEMKRIIGGNEIATTCSTSCDAGYYACCTRPLGLGQGAKCKCIPFSSELNTSDEPCDTGGVGQSSCSIE